MQVIQGDAFDLDRTLGARHAEPFAGIVSGLPLLNFPIAAAARLSSMRLAERLVPGAPLIQFSYGMHAPVVPPDGFSVRLRRPGLGQSPARAGLGVSEDLNAALLQ